MKILTLEEDMGLESPVFSTMPESNDALLKRIVRATEHMDVCKVKGVRHLNSDVIKLKKQVQVSVIV